MPGPLLAVREDDMTVTGGMGKPALRKLALREANLLAGCPDGTLDVTLLSDWKA
jgi:hypothetical protein